MTIITDRDRMGNMQGAVRRTEAVTALPTNNLHVLRAIAVLCVLVDHTLTATALPNAAWLPELGRVGVLLFFVHTSLVLMSSLERQGDGAIRFYVRRAFRIYPLAVVAIVVVVLLGLPTNVPAIVGEQPITLKQLAANLLLVQNLVAGAPDIISSLWSLPIEEQMYVLLPACFAVAQRGVRPVVRLLGFGMIAAAAVILNPHLWRASIALYGPCFVAGVLTFATLKRPPCRRLRAWVWPIAILAALPVAIGLGATAAAPVRSWVFCLVVACLLPCVQELPASWLTRVAGQ